MKSNTKPSKKSSAVALLAVVACMAAASASGADMKVAGKIAPPTCDVKVHGEDGGSEINFDVNFDALDPNASTAVPSKLMMFEVDCGARRTAIAIRAVDNNADGKPTDARSFHFSDNIITTGIPSNRYFGLGLAASGKPVGAYAVRIKRVQVDSNNFNTLVTSSDGINWSAPATAAYFSTDQPYITAGSLGAAGSFFRIPLDIGANISRTSDFPPGNVALAGSATIEVLYF